jgi:tyrosine-protein phosphatase non-receptor type 11
LQNKCARYWPEDGQFKEYGPVKVKSLSESSNTDYTLREFVVSKEGSTDERKVFHFHFQVIFDPKSPDIRRL